MHRFALAFLGQSEVGINLAGLFFGTQWHIPQVGYTVGDALFRTHFRR